MGGWLGGCVCVGGRQMEWGDFRELCTHIKWTAQVKRFSRTSPQQMERKLLAFIDDPGDDPPQEQARRLPPSMCLGWVQWWARL